MPNPSGSLSQTTLVKNTLNSRRRSFLLLLAGLALLCGYLLSKINLVGRAGIVFFYKEYAIFRSWWKSALAVFAIWLFLFWLHGVLEKRLVRRQAMLLHGAALAIACIGLLFTYNDFRTDVTHRIIGERFHLGFYLFWVGWMLIGLYYLLARQRTETV